MFRVCSAMGIAEPASDEAGKARKMQLFADMAAVG